MPSGTLRFGSPCQPALSSSSTMLRSRPAPASLANSASNSSKNGLETPFDTYQSVSLLAGATKTVGGQRRLPQGHRPDRPLHQHQGPGLYLRLKSPHAEHRVQARPFPPPCCRRDDARSRTWCCVISQPSDQRDPVGAWSGTVKGSSLASTTKIASRLAGTVSLAFSLIL
jgi:hypothetical protein